MELKIILEFEDMNHAKSSGLKKTRQEKSER